MKTKNEDKSKLIIKFIIKFQNQSLEFGLIIGLCLFQFLHLSVLYRRHDTYLSEMADEINQ